jgi:transcription initiation factor TFIID subunit 6
MFDFLLVLLEVLTVARHAQEASRFTRHAHRTTMTTSDIDQALRVLNIEPLYGHNPHNPPTFRRALPFPQATSAGTVYYVEDEEIDFDRVLREEKIPLPKPANWTAHWLAVEGVQPLIPENPPAIPRDTEGEAGKLGASPPRLNGQAPPTPPSPNRPAGAFASKGKQPQLVKQVLSRELQLYYTRLTSALVQTDQVKRTAALSSLASDAGLQTLLPYLVKWVGDGVVQILQDSVQTEQEARLLDVYLEVVRAILDNKTLLVEPYVSVLS